MILKLKAGNNASNLAVEATKKKINGRYVWRIVFPKNETIFIAELNGRCKPVGKIILSHELLNELGGKLSPALIVKALNVLGMSSQHTILKHG